MQKHNYVLVFNHCEPVKSPIVAAFGRSKGIMLHIRENGVLISVQTIAEKNTHEILNGEDNLFTDAVRKALTIYTIRYGRFLDIKKAKVSVDGQLKDTFIRSILDPPLIYSLSKGKLRAPFNLAWSKHSVYNTIASVSKSGYDGRFTAMHALLAAKSDRYEIERFTYYWMAMNGLYGYVARQGRLLLDEKALNAEYKEIAFLARCYGHEPCQGKNGDNLPRKHVRQIYWHTAAVMKHIPMAEIDSFCTACMKEDLTNRYLKTILDGLIVEDCNYSNYSAFSLMLLLIPYRIRCEAFHAGNALPTFCYKDDAELQVLRVVNCLLDNFLTQELAFWLDTDVSAETKQQVMLKQAVENRAYDKWRI